MIINIRGQGPHWTGIGWEGGLLAAKAARTVQRRDKQVNATIPDIIPMLLNLIQVDWLEAALATAPEEEHGRIGRLLEKAVMEHDQILLAGGLGQVSQDAPDGLPEVPVFTRYQDCLNLICSCQADADSWRQVKGVRGKCSTAEGRSDFAGQRRRPEIQGGD